MNMTQTLGASENFDPNTLDSGAPQFGHQNSSYEQFASQQEAWSEELRRADDRCARFKADLGKSHAERDDLYRQIDLLNERVTLRDVEIKRL